MNEFIRPVVRDVPSTLNFSNDGSSVDCTFSNAVSLLESALFLSYGRYYFISVFFAIALILFE